MKIFDANISGSLTVSGSARFQSDITVDGVINATISGTTSNAISASFATEANKLDGKDSTEFAITGSNVFKANQTVSGSLYVTNDVVINGTSYTAASSGSSGTSGSSGSNGSSGTSGSNGSSGTSGSDGSSGTSGSSGSNGSSGTSGTSGSSGSNGSSGTSGSSGSNGSSGTSGSSGSNGSSGTSGSSGTAGTSGTSVTVSGTDNVLGKFSSNSMVNSNVSDNGSVVKINSDTTITGSLTITQNLNVLGSSSITYTTASQLRVNDNVITVNASSPGVRFAGLSVIDSGSSPTVSGSFLFDSLNNQFLYVHTNQATVTSSVVLVGAQTYNSLGSETLPTTNRLIKSLGQEHLGDSNISDNGTTIVLNSNSEVTGSLKVTTNVTAVGFSGSLQGSISGNAATVTTNANLTGDVTSTGNATTIGALKVTDGMLAGSISNAKLTNSSVTVTAGTGMSGGGAVALGSSVTLTNAGVTSIIAGTGISRDVATGGVTITNSGVTSAVAGTGVSVSAGTGAVTFSIGQAVGTGASVQFANGYITTGLGVGTAAPATVGLIRATNDVIAYYASDERLKENFENIPNSLDKLKQINGYSFDWIPMEGIHENEGHDIGVKAQEIEAVLPEIVTTRENGYKAVKYDRLVALLIETNKELLNRIEALEAKIK